MSKKLKILPIIFVVIFTAATWFYLAEFLDRKARKEISEFGETIVYQCSEDSQCISVELIDCCVTRRAINKRFKRYWNDKQKVIDELFTGLCPAISCPPQETGRPKCVNKECKLINIK